MGGFAREPGQVPLRRPACHAESLARPIGLGRGFLVEQVIEGGFLLRSLDFSFRLLESYRRFVLSSSEQIFQGPTVGTLKPDAQGRKYRSVALGKPISDLDLGQRRLGEGKKLVVVHANSLH